MTRYSFLAPLWRSWWPGDLYADVAQNRRGGGGWWLFLLTGICSLAVILFMKGFIQTQVADNLPDLIKEVPVVTIKNGVVSTPGNRPAYIHERGDASATVFVAILPEATEVPKENAATPFVVLRDRVVIQSRGRPPQVHVLSEVKDFTLDEAHIRSGVAFAANVFPWLILPFWIVAMYIWHLVIWLGLSIVAAVANAVFGGGLTYGAMLRVVSRAMTPAMILNAAYLIGTFQGVSNVPFWYLIVFALTIVLVALATRAAGKSFASPSAAPAIPPPPMPGML